MGSLDPWWQQVRNGCFYYRTDKNDYIPIDISSNILIDERKNEMKKHEGKILIQVDEKDQNKIIAKNLITGEMAEALCSPADEFDFEAGARIALKRLTKKKGWNGKVICIETNNPAIFNVGEGYICENGMLNDRRGKSWESQICRFKSVDELNHSMEARKHSCGLAWAQFIEYKGGAD